MANKLKASVGDIEILPPKPYGVELLDFDGAVAEEFPGRDPKLEEYLVEQAIKRGKDPNRPYKRQLPSPDWSKRGDKIDVEHYEHGSMAQKRGEAGHYSPGHSGQFLDEEGNPHDYEVKPTIRMFTRPENAPYTHEFMHHLNQVPRFEDPRKRLKLKDAPWGFKWHLKPHEVQSEASAKKREYLYETQNYPSHDLKDNLAPLDRDHPAVKEGKPLPEEHIDRMFQKWMVDDEDGDWGGSYERDPENFPVELFKEALRLGQNNKKPTGMFTGKAMFS